MKSIITIENVKYSVRELRHNYLKDGRFQGKNSFEFSGLKWAKLVTTDFSSI